MLFGNIFCDEILNIALLRFIKGFSQINGDPLAQPRYVTINAIKCKTYLKNKEDNEHKWLMCVLSYGWRKNAAVEP